MPPSTPDTPPSEALLQENRDQTRVTLRDIARNLGVSHVAVSLALRDRPGVSDELRVRIRKVADKLGYRPDPALAALNSYRHDRESRPIRAALGWITLSQDPARMHALQEYDSYWQGAKQVAEKYGYHLYEFNPDAKHSLAAVQRVMQARSIEGVMLSPPDAGFFSNPPVLMDWNLFSVVRLSNALADNPFHLISSAQVSNTQLAIRRMRERGYKRIGFVTSSRSIRYTYFLNGFLRVNEDAPASRRIPHLCLPELKPADDRASLAAWLKQHRPDAVFSNLGSIRSLLTQVGCDVPGRLGLAVTSVQDCDSDTGIDQCPVEIGKTACETLISLVMHGHRGIPAHPREILVGGRWLEGSTLPQRPILAGSRNSAAV